MEKHKAGGHREKWWTGREGRVFEDKATVIHYSMPP